MTLTIANKAHARLSSPSHADHLRAKAVAVAGNESPSQPKRVCRSNHRGYTLQQ